MEKIIGYKFLTSNMKSRHGNITWKLGEWQKHKGKIKLCELGFHAYQEPRDAFINYIYGERFFIVEARGKVKTDQDMFVASEMRLIREVNLKKVSVEWAVYCAKQALKIYRKKYPNDDRPRKAVEAAALAALAASWAASAAVWAGWAAGDAEAAGVPLKKQNTQLKKIIKKWLIE